MRITTILAANVVRWQQLTIGPLRVDVEVDAIFYANSGYNFVLTEASRERLAAMHTRGEIIECPSSISFVKGQYKHLRIPILRHGDLVYLVQHESGSWACAKHIYEGGMA